MKLDFISNNGGKGTTTQRRKGGDSSTFQGKKMGNSTIQRRGRKATPLATDTKKTENTLLGVSYLASKRSLIRPEMGVFDKKLQTPEKSVSQ